MRQRKRSTGSALVAVMIFVAVFAALALGYLTVAAANLQTARTVVESSRALMAAESGMAIARAELPLLTLSREDADSPEALEALRDSINARLAAVGGGGTAVISGSEILLPAVVLNFPEGPATFQIRVVADGHDRYAVSSTGAYGVARKAIGATFDVVEDIEILTHYGVASKSPIKMKGNAQVVGVNEPKEGTVLSTSYVTLDPIDITGHVLISGDCAISNPNGNVSYKGNTHIDGDILIGVREPPFPDIDTTPFEDYVVYRIDSGTNTTSDCYFENVRIVANTNPTFTARCILRGVIYIESPNVVKFTGSTDVAGIIVAEPPANPLDFAHNSITFTGNVSANSPATLPLLPRFSEIRKLTGSFLLAPGYDVLFDGNFSTINGSIVASKMAFGGSSEGTIVGTVINCDDTYFEMSGDASVRIDHSQVGETPAGMSFPKRMLYVGGTYTE